ncbi:MAG: hypothetical protein ACLFSE_14210 [Spirochaetia bacterium]
MKKFIIIMILLAFAAGAGYTQEFSGEWVFTTELIQAISDGIVIGFANPENENQIEKIIFSPDGDVDIIYHGDTFDSRWFKDGNMLFFDTPSGESLVITLFKISDTSYKFSYCLASAKENLVSGIKKKGFVNFIGVMEYQQ